MVLYGNHVPHSYLPSKDNQAWWREPLGRWFFPKYDEGLGRHHLWGALGWQEVYLLEIQNGRVKPSQCVCSNAVYFAPDAPTRDTLSSGQSPSD